MTKRHTTHFMLIGLGLYVFGLVLFISGGKDAANDEDVLTKNGRQVAQNTYDYKWKFHGDNSTQNGMKTLKYSKKQEFYNRSKHKRNMPVKNYKIVNFKNRKIYNRKKSIGDHSWYVCCICISEVIRMIFNIY